MQDSPNYYQILKVSRSATLQDIKKAYRRLARQYHPDLHPENPALGERFKEINQAYHVLSNPVLRSHYDQKLTTNGSASKTAGMNDRDFYARAVTRALDKDYQGAVEDCNQAIALNPLFVEAYVERGVARYKLGDARGTLQDCNQALSINPQFVQAYYYQGRARYRLGYTQAAIEAYTQAIARDSAHARAYYHRGLAHNDLKEYDRGFEDLQKAAALFSDRGDKTGYQLVQETLKTLHQAGRLRQRFSGINPVAILKTIFEDAIAAFLSFALNPTGGLLPSFVNLGQQRAIFASIVFAGIFNICFVWGIYVGWRDFLNISTVNLIIVGLVPFVTLATLSAILRSLAHRPGSLAGDIYLAATTLMPLSVAVLASSISTLLGSQVMSVITLFASCYTILTLYSGCTQIANLSESTAAFVVPAMLLVSGWFFYWVLQMML